MLTVGAAWQHMVPGLLRKVGQQEQQPAELRQIDAVGAPQHHELARLGDVLRGCSPVGVATGVAFTHPVKLPDNGHQRVSRAGQSPVDGV